MQTHVRALVIIAMYKIHHNIPSFIIEMMVKADMTYTTRSKTNAVIDGNVSFEK